MERKELKGEICILISICRDENQIQMVELKYWKSPEQERQP